MNQQTQAIIEAIAGRTWKFKLEEDEMVQTIDKASFDRLALVLEKALEQRDQAWVENQEGKKWHQLIERDDAELVKLARGETPR